MMKKCILCLIILIFVIITVSGFYSDTYTCTIYKVGNNSITQQVSKKDVKNYIKNYEWSVEPTILLYTADGKSSWICESEVDNYLSTGLWFKEKQIEPPNITMNPFLKTNLQPNQIEMMLSNGLSGYGQAFYNMERKHGVNSVFAISVAELESGYGTSYAFRKRNNAFGIASGKHFNSVEEGIDYFGQLMNKSIYYGKSINEIGSIYCESKDWASKVKLLMKKNYLVLGY